MRTVLFLLLFIIISEGAISQKRGCEDCLSRKEEKELLKRAYELNKIRRGDLDPEDSKFFNKRALRRAARAAEKAEEDWWEEKQRMESEERDDCPPDDPKCEGIILKDLPGTSRFNKVKFSAQTVGGKLVPRTANARMGGLSLGLGAEVIQAQSRDAERHAEHKVHRKENLQQWKVIYRVMNRITHKLLPNEFESVKECNLFIDENTCKCVGSNCYSQTKLID